MDNLEPGKYFISTQGFNPPDGMRFHEMVLATKADDPQSIFMIEITDNISLPYQLDMGDVAIILP